jgi:transcriptional regulator with XRE-family HTH domain
MDTTILRKFGDRVKALRLKKGLSQEGLANLCDLHRTYIGSIERYERNVSLLNVERIAIALGVKISKLLE